jgi:hypothetical protein
MTRLLFILAALFTVAAPGAEAPLLGARPSGPRNPSRPVASAPSPLSPLSVVFSRRTVLWDGMQVAKEVMTFGPDAALEMNWNLFYQWRRVAMPGVSVAWVHSAIPEVRLTLTALPATPAKLLLEPGPWNVLVGSLLPRGLKNLRVLCDDDTQANPQMLRLMGWRTRVYECAFEAGTNPNETQARLVVACSDGTVAYVFALEGPEAALPAHLEVEHILTSLEPLQK